jgi:ATP-dependent Clp protease ATP-binding subunit ClpC
MAERELQLELTDPAKELLVEKGWDPAMGARPLRRAIQRYIEDPLADFVLREQVIPGATVVVNPAAEGEEGEVRLTVVKPKKQKTPVAVGAEGAAGELPAGEDLGADLGEDLPDGDGDEPHVDEPDVPVDAAD